MNAHKVLVSLVVAMAAVIVVLLGVVAWGLATRSAEVEWRDLFGGEAEQTR